MSEPALRSDVIAALEATDGITVREIGNSSVEVAKGVDLRAFPLKKTVSRGMLWNLCRWYEVPFAAFFPPTKK